MSDRPSDWWVLDLDADPTPGDPFGIRELAGRFLGLSADASEVAGAVRGAAGSEVVASWVGAAGDAYRDEIGGLPKDLDKLCRSYGMAGQALRSYAGALEGAQRQADAALARGRDARARRDGAQAQVNGAQAAVGQAATAVDRARTAVPATAGGGSLAPSADQIATAVRDHQAAQARLSQARAGLSSAQEELDAARRLALAAQGLREGAEDTAVHQLKAASHAGIRNKGWWGHFKDGLAKAWHITVAIAKVAVVVLGVVLLFVSGPLLIGLMVAASVILLVDTLDKYEHGQASLLEVGLAAASLIPGGRFLTEAEDGVRLAGAGEELADAARDVRAVSGERTAISAVVSEPRERAVAAADRRLCGDPVDVATGEMVLAQTDVALPGLLALAVERTHISSYRVGGVFGRSWASTLDQRLEVEATAVWYASADGMLLLFPTPPVSGEPVAPVEGPRYQLARTPAGYTLTLPATGRTLHFPSPDDPADPAQPAQPAQPTEAAVGGVRTVLVAGGTVETLTRPRVLALSAVSDRNGHRIEVDYDDAGLPVALRHSGGYHLGLDTVDGLITAIRLTSASDTDDTDDSDDSDGEAGRGPVLVRYDYDDRGRLVGVINSSGRPLRFDYDPAGRITGWTDRNGTTYRYLYDAAGRCVAGTGTDGILTALFAYDTDAGVTTVADSLGHPTVFHLNDTGQTIRVVDPLGHATRYTWDRYDRLLARTDPLGRTTTYRYDQAGNRTGVIRPDGSHLHATFNDFGQPTSVTGWDGTVWRYTYDQRGNLTAATDPAGATTRYTYDNAGRLVSVTDPLGHTTHTTSNPAGLPLTVTDPTGATTHYSYNPHGRIASVLDRVGGHTQLGWTVEGALTSRTAPDGTTEAWTYDGEGNLVEHTNAAGLVTRTRIGPFDLPAATINPDGARLEYAYDTEQRLIAVTNPQGLVWRYDYDPAGRLTSETDFNNRVTDYDYDAAGALVARTNGAGETVHFVRDPLGNIIEQHAPDGVTTFAYDPAGRVVGATNADADCTFQRDAVGRVIAETCNGRRLSSSFDALGRRTRRTTPSGAESRWDHDWAGRPTQLRTGGQTLRFTFDAAGRQTGAAFGADVTLEQTWDAAHRLTAQTLTTASAPAQSAGAPSPGRRTLQRRDYTYSPDGYPTRIDDLLAGRRDYTLDPARRVTTVDGPSGPERYTYDPAGNITRATWPVASTGSDDESATAPIGFRDYTGTLVRRAGKLRYEHDSQGRVIRRHHKTLSGKTRTWHYTWDAHDRLIEIATPDGGHWRYLYDPFNRRTAKQRLTPDRTIAEQITFTWDGTHLAEQTHTRAGEPAALDTTWDWEPGTFRPLTQTNRRRHDGHSDGDGQQDQQWYDAEFHAIITNLTGTPTELVDPDGTIAWQADTTLWGVSATHGTTDCPLRYPGQYQDPETGLAHNHHRVYDPTLGRYLTPDPLGLTPAPNPHTYVHNPLTWIDPFGLTPCTPGNAPENAVDLYHGTNSSGAESILKNGVDPSYAPRNRDFGNGFYTSKDRSLVEDWAARVAGRRGGDPVVLHFKVPASALDSLDSLKFEGDSPALRNFLRSMRTGGSHGYEMVSGPLLRNVSDFLDGADPVLFGDQTVFFGDRAAQLLNESLVR